ncbi:MAG: hypothetical protein WBQ94_30300 [Terracidiphilus sp.]
MGFIESISEFQAVPDFTFVSGHDFGVLHIFIPFVRHLRRASQRCTNNH